MALTVEERSARLLSVIFKLVHHHTELDVLLTESWDEYDRLGLDHLSDEEFCTWQRQMVADVKARQG